MVGRGFCCPGILGDGTDGMGWRDCVGVAVSERGRWSSRGAAQVVQQPESVGGHGETAPAGRGAVEHGLDQRLAALLHRPDPRGAVGLG
jgi:hypothetical protein